MENTTKLGPPRPRTIYEVFERNARTPQTALVTPSYAITYRELVELGLGWARWLVARGVSQGDRVACVLPNSALMLALIFATARLGVVLVPVSTWSVPRELRALLDHSGAKLAVAVDGFGGQEFAGTLLQACEDPKVPLEHAEIVGDTGPGAYPRGSIATAAELIDLELGQCSAPYLVLYTSGTTGEPKGVVHCQGAIVRNATNIAARMGMSASDRVFTYFPMFFSAGFCNALMTSASSNATLVSMDKFSDEVGRELLITSEPTVRITWPSALDDLLGENPTDSLEAAVRKMTRGLVVSERTRSRISGFADQGINMYGMTETATAFTCTSFSDPDDIRLNTHGVPFPGSELRLVDSEGVEILRPEETGMIEVKGYNLMLGYAGRTSHLNEDGFFSTGDYGHLTGQGQLVFLGRAKAAIKARGFLVHPEEVESVLLGIEGVSQACVVGVPAPMHTQKGTEQGEVVVALVTLTDPRHLSTEDIAEVCRRQLSSYKRPTRIVALDGGLPLNASGKVQRSVLQQLAEEIVYDDRRPL